MNKDIQDRLRKYPSLPRTIFDKNAEFRKFKDDIFDTLKGQTIDDMPKGNGTSDLTLNKVMDLAEELGIMEDANVFLNQYKTIINNLYNEKLLLDKALLSLTLEEKKIIEKRYFDGLDWKYIPAHLGYSEEYWRLRKNEAIEKIKKYFN